MKGSVVKVSKISDSLKYMHVNIFFFFFFFFEIKNGFKTT